VVFSDGIFLLFNEAEFAFILIGFSDENNLLYNERELIVVRLLSGQRCMVAV